MPEDFLRCIREKGKVRTKTLSGGKYIRICFKGGKSYSGEVQQKTSNGYMKAKKT